MRRLLLPCLLVFLAPPALAGPGDKALRAVPRELQVSVGRDHIWGSVRAARVPADLGKADWSDWDRDASGALENNELRGLAAWIGSREVVHVAISVDGITLPFPQFAGRYVGDDSVPVPLDGLITVRVEGRTKVALSPGEHEFVLYDVPPTPDGFIPIRLTTVKGFRILEAQGTRGEKRGDRRLEATVTAFTPAMWGTFERVVRTAPK